MSAKLVFENLEFNDGTSISLTENSITIFVGANNVGKTAALKNLFKLSNKRLAGYRVHNVIKDVSFKKIGTKEEFIEFIKSNKYIQSKDFHINIGGRDYNLEKLPKLWEENSGSDFGQLFMKFMLTENRITYSNNQQSKDFNREEPSHPIHLMYLDELLENQISSYFKQAFNLDLVVDRFAGSNIYLKIRRKTCVIER